MTISTSAFSNYEASLSLSTYEDLRTRFIFWQVIEKVTYIAFAALTGLGIFLLSKLPLFFTISLFSLLFLQRHNIRNCIKSIFQNIHAQVKETFQAVNRCREERELAIKYWEETRDFRCVIRLIECTTNPPVYEREIRGIEKRPSEEVSKRLVILLTQLEQCKKDILFSNKEIEKYATQEPLVNAHTLYLHDLLFSKTIDSLFAECLLRRPYFPGNLEHLGRSRHAGITSCMLNSFLEDKRPIPYFEFYNSKIPPLCFPLTLSHEEAIARLLEAMDKRVSGAS